MDSGLNLFQRNSSGEIYPGIIKIEIYQNYHYWWIEDNKRSTRYTCCDKYTKKCGGSITVSQDKVTRSTGHTGHTCLTDNQVKILVKGQELKKKSKLDKF